MRSWEDYKKTIPTEDPVFDFARNGNVEGLHVTITDSNLNKKDGKGYSPLMLSAYNGHLEASEFLLKLSADPDSKDNSGNTILMGAAFKGNVDIVKLLIRYGADPLAQNEKQQTALQFAKMFGRKEVAEFLDSTKRFAVTDQVSSWLTYLFPKKRGI